MRSLFGRPVLTAGDAQYFWEDVLLASVLRGDWSDLERLVREELDCARRSREGAGEPSPAEVDAAAADFRYERNLVSAAETYAWLERWGLGAGEWMEWVRRSLARARAGRPPGGGATDLAAAEEEVLLALPVTLVCSGAADRFALALAERAAALAVAGDGGDAATEAVLARFPADLAARGFGALSAARLRERERVVARAECGLRRFREMVLTPRALHHEVGGRHLDWIRVEYCSAYFPTESMAREAVLCVREDGLALDEVAAGAGTSLRRARCWLEEVERGLRERLLASRSGELLGPVRENGGFLVHRVESKCLPTLEDPEVRRRAEQSALRSALAAAVNDRVRWKVAS